jgi:DNA-binding response OmpR family regulator
MSNPVRILSISDDEGLRFSRELLLSSDGYEIESIASTTALSFAHAESFDVALICRSVVAERAATLTEMLRQCNPEIQILCISPLETQTERCGGGLEIASGPEPLLDAVREVCKQRAAQSIS